MTLRKGASAALGKGATAVMVRTLAAAIRCILETDRGVAGRSGRIGFHGTVRFVPVAGLPCDEHTRG